MSKELRVGLEHAIKTLEYDLEQHYEYEGSSLQEGIYHALELLREELEHYE